MITLFKKTALATALAASALASATPAMADGYHGRGGGDVAGPAIAAGIFGLAIGAIIASSSHHDHDRVYRDGYYDNRDNGYGYNGGYYQNGAPRPYYSDRDGYRYDHDGRPYGYDRAEHRGW